MMENRVYWLDHARLTAAVAVVAYHYFFFGLPGISERTDFGVLSVISEYGYLGAEFFFIISGFVIFYSASDTTAQRFAAARIVRLYPTFLCCMTITTIARYVAGRPLSVASYLANLTMVPRLFGRQAADGVYWSLEFELAFYCAIFFLLVARVKDFEPWVRCWIMLQLLLLPWHVPFLSGYYSLFAGGATLALIYQRGVTTSRGMFLMLAVLLSCWNAAGRHPGSPPLTVALTTSFFAAFLLLRRAKPLPGAKRAGALTYPLYLLHSEIGAAARPWIANKWIWLFLASSAVVLLAVFTATYVDGRLKHQWRALVDRLIVSGSSLFLSVIRPNRSTGTD